MFMFLVIVAKVVKKEIIEDNQPFYKMFAFFIALLRSFMFSYFLLILACNINNFNDNSTLIKFLKIFMFCSTLIMLLLISFFLSHLFVL